MGTTWPTFTLEALLQRLQQGDPPAGADCCYVQWDERTGLKLYPKRIRRSGARRAQARAARRGLAPPVGPALALRWPTWDEFDDPGFRSLPLYAHWTRHAEHLEVDDEDDDRWADQLAQLRRRLERIGIVHHDLWPRNAGHWEGRLVCVDFGYESCHVAPLRTVQRKGA